MAHEANLTQTVLKALDVLECLAAVDYPLTTPEVARRCRLSRPTAYRLLTTLESRGYVATATDGAYHLGLSLLSLGRNLLDHLDLPKLAAAHLRELSRLSNETVHLGVLDHNTVLYIDKIESSHAVRMHSRIGARNALHCTAMGKAILAFLPPEDCTTLLTQLHLEPHTPCTLTDRTRLEEHLQGVREQGFAIDDIENEEGIRCVGAPILDAEGRAFAAISISGPAYRLPLNRLAELAGPLIGATRTISGHLGYRQSNNHR